ncbi:MAG TPA: histidine kinase [Thermoanaerobaculia bacterium]|nr:histidine kinase [Thermoanaerobaculia bacterium]
MTSENLSLPRILLLARTAGLILAGSAAIGALDQLRRSLAPTPSTSPPETVYVDAIGALLWALTAPFLLYAAWRLPVRAPHAIRNLFLLASSTFAISAVHNIAWALVASPILLRDYFSGLSPLAVTAYDHMILHSLIVIAAQYWRLSSENAERLRAEAGLAAEIAQARLRQLRADLNPHFLFNTLNSIAALLNDHPKEAKSVLRVLSELLHRSNEWWLKREIPLSEEISFVERYLDIQRVRFRDRLSVTVDVPPSLAGALVPPLILQPLVENAVIHGIAPFPWPGTIRIEASRGGDCLKISIRNSGRGLQRPQKPEPGVGIANVRARLRWMYGERQQLTLAIEPDGYRAGVTIPWSAESAG